MGYPPQGGPPGYPPHPPQAPGYGGYGAPPPAAPPQAPHAPASFNNRPVAEVAGEGRSKAQLIVGIDFVSDRHPCPATPATPCGAATRPSLLSERTLIFYSC
jgi:hypothetical protein